MKIAMGPLAENGACGRGAALHRHLRSQVARAGRTTFGAATACITCKVVAAHTACNWLRWISGASASSHQFTCYQSHAQVCWDHEYVKEVRPRVVVHDAGSWFTKQVHLNRSADSSTAIEIANDVQRGQYGHGRHRADATAQPSRYSAADSAWDHPQQKDHLQDRNEKGRGEKGYEKARHDESHAGPDARGALAREWRSHVQRSSGGSTDRN